jgi:ubiquinone/menaquinone biosynthesis C-methylase UbiE
MGWWTDRVVPRITNRLLDAPDVHEMRAQACTGLSGRVLEIGFGSGLNAGHYPSSVTEVAAVEPSDLGWQLAAERIARLPIPVSRVGLDGQRLAAPDGEYDAVLSTFSLCTIPDVRRALAEVRRVLKPGGTFHFAEHGRAPDPSVARWQDRLQPLNGLMAGGCHLTRPIVELVAEQLTVTDLVTGYAPGPKASRPFSFRYIGRAVASP